MKLFNSISIAPCAYMPENVCLDHIPSYVFHKSVIQPQGYIKYVKIIHNYLSLNINFKL